jgi:hypothetical protein
MQNPQLRLLYFDQHPPVRVLTKMGFVGTISEYFLQTLTCLACMFGVLEKKLYVRLENGDFGLPDQSMAGF